MSIILPTAPTNFYLPSLNTLKDDLDSVNGQTVGQVTLLTAAPNNADIAWSEVGAGNADLDTNRGSLVVAQKPIVFIAGPSPAYLETTEEFGYKLEFAKIPEIEIKLPAGVDSALLVGLALIIGNDTFAGGVNDDVRYLGKIEDIVVTNTNKPRISLKSFPGVRDISVDDGDIIELPEWSIIINYAQPVST